MPLYIKVLASLQVILEFFFFFLLFHKNWVGRAMRNETFYGDGLTGNRQWPFKQANHDAYSNLGTLTGSGPSRSILALFRRRT